MAGMARMGFISRFLVVKYSSVQVAPGGREPGVVRGEVERKW